MLAYEQESFRERGDEKVLHSIIFTRRKTTRDKEELSTPIDTGREDIGWGLPDVHVQDPDCFGSLILCTKSEEENVC